MTSQRDEMVGHMTGDDMTDDPIVVERHDEILGGPVDDTKVDDPAADDPAADDLAADDLAADDLAADDPALDEPARDEPASDELVGRHAAPDIRGTGPDEAPPPLVVPPETAPAGDFAGSSPAATAADPVTHGRRDPGDPATAAGPATAASPASGTAASAETVPGTGTAQETGTAQATGTTGATAGSVPAAALAGQQWPAIQALFVDDPKGSVERAAAAADEEVKAFVASLQREQEGLRAAWANDASTEDLRTALQQYRAFCGRLEGLA